jgi:lipopolysaccharide export system permease protein
LATGRFRALRFALGQVFLVAVNLLDRYLLREWLKIFGLVLVATLGLLLVQATYSDLSDLLEQGAGAADLIVYFAVKLPGYLGLVLPIAMLLSLLYALGQMHRNGEIIARRAAGQGLLRLTLPLWLAGVMLCGVVWALNVSVVPWSVEEANSIRLDLRLRHERRTEGADRAGVREAVAFESRRAGRMWFFNRFNRLTQRGSGVSVVELDAGGRERTRLLARVALPRPVPAGAAAGSRGWEFRDGRELVFDPATGEVQRSVAFAELARPDFTEDPALLFAFDDRPDRLSFHELGRLIAFLEAEDSPKLPAYAVRYHALLADAMVPLIVILLAVPFAVTGVRVNPAVGVTKSIGLFAIYFLLVKASYALGARGLVPPVWAALAPNAVMLALGGVFFVRAR